MNILFSTSVFALITLTPFGNLLEQSLLTHVLIEIPALIIIGITIGTELNNFNNRITNNLKHLGIPGILLASFVIGFWMIPRWLDASINIEYINYIKYYSLVFLAGIPIGLSWPRLPFIAVGFVKIELLAMLFRIGWIYQVSPVRLCNNYLLSEQQYLGAIFIYIGLLLGLIWTYKIFFCDNEITT